MAKKQIRKAGAIIKIVLYENKITYGRVLEHAKFVFYNYIGEDEISINEIIKLPILFFASVDKYAITRGRWEIIGTIPLETELLAPPPVYIQDVIKKDKFRIYYQDGSMRDATRNDCIGLEEFGVWSPEQIEERLRSYYGGNKDAQYCNLIL